MSEISDKIEIRNLGTDVEITATLIWHTELLRDAVKQYATRYKGKHHKNIVAPVCEELAQKLADAIEEQKKRSKAIGWKQDQDYRNGTVIEV